MRISKSGRHDNAYWFYHSLMNNGQIAFVVVRSYGVNHMINRCKFVAHLNGMARPIIIAESTQGIEGCFNELCNFIKKSPPKNYRENDFNDWLIERYGFTISYQDNQVFVLKREDKEYHFS